ncbi:MAG: hypothetical protein AMXMBFR64_55840 [Myxococcales bacterium]
MTSLSTTDDGPAQGPRLYRDLAECYPLPTPADCADEAGVYRRLFDMIVGIDFRAPQPWACDGECHAETCTGGAGEQCDMFGCTNMQWTCSSNQCIKIPWY